MSHLILLENVSKHFRIWKASLKVTVIENLSLSIDKGESVLFLGPNGSGKSTLLRMIATLSMPSSGTIHVYGYNTKNRNRSLLNLIGFMPEECKFHSGMSGLKFLHYLGKLMGIKDTKTRARNIINEFGLTKWECIDVSVYSEGMKQRLGLCAALLNNPKVVLLDEPFSNLDENMKNQLDKFLRDYAEKGNIVIASSHERIHFTGYRELKFPIREET